MWFVKKKKGGEGSFAYYWTHITVSGRCVLACMCSQAGEKREKNNWMPSMCVSLSQIVSHSVSSCVCVSAVAERNSLQGEEMEERV